jgi:hypothetical protein
MSYESEMPQELISALIGMDAEAAAFALMASIGADGHPTPETVELLLDATMRLADDDTHRQAEAASFLATLTGCLAQVAAQCSRELQNRGIELDWRSN